MALKDVWREQRQQRQREVAERQQQVYESLITVRQERQDKAIQLRDDLSLFRVELARNNQVRYREFQRFQADLQNFCQILQQETQQFLTAASDRRQAQAQQLAQKLDAFVQALQQQTAQFLSMTEADRLAMAHQLASDLRAFHKALSATVVSLRREIRTLHQQIQAEVAALKANTQTFLNQSQQQRLQMQVKLIRQLAAFTEVLRAEVEQYLQEMEMLRQSRANELHQTLNRSRQQRLTQVQKLFERLSIFRSELHKYHTNLQQSVWGQAGTVAPIRSSKPQPAKVGQTRPVPATRPIATRPASTSPAIAPRPTSPQAAPTRSVPPEVVPQVITAAQPAAALSTPPLVGAFSHAGSVAVIPPTATSTTPEEAIAYEKDVFNYIHAIHGARLTEIESALGINRFQAVDALRSLIKKGLVTQRDRVYLVHEELTQL